MAKVFLLLEGIAHEFFKCIAHALAAVTLYYILSVAASAVALSVQNKSKLCLRLLRYCKYLPTAAISTDYTLSKQPNHAQLLPFFITITYAAKAYNLVTIFCLTAINNLI